jgi:predicted nucleic acid-binding protein
MGPRRALVKGVDTPLLLLEGRPEAGVLTDGDGGEEVCTTEVNLFELETLARGGPRQGRGRRLAAIERLRRKLTVLPMDERAAREASALAAGGGRGLPTPSLLVLGTLIAAGASEVLTTDASALQGASIPVRVTVVRRKAAKSH